MGSQNPTPCKFTWRIEKFSRLKEKKYYSDVFTIGGCKWYQNRSFMLNRVRKIVPFLFPLLNDIKGLWSNWTGGCWFSPKEIIRTISQFTWTFPTLRLCRPGGAERRISSWSWWTRIERALPRRWVMACFVQRLFLLLSPLSEFPVSSWVHCYLLFSKHIGIMLSEWFRTKNWYFAFLWLWIHFMLL